MTQTGFHIFDEMFQKSLLLLKAIEAEFGWPEDRRIQSYTALRAVLHTLRDRLTADQAVKLGAQLPSLIRGMYYEGWVPSKAPRKIDREEFANEVRREFTYSVDMGFDTFIRKVIGVLARHVSPGEIEDVRNELPGDFSTYFEEAPARGRKTA